MGLSSKKHGSEENKQLMCDKNPVDFHCQKKKNPVDFQET
jgi:hypothetical protein